MFHLAREYAALATILLGLALAVAPAGPVRAAAPAGAAVGAGALPAQAEPATTANNADGQVGPWFMGICFIIVVAILIGIGVVLGLAALLILVVLMVVGVASASVAAGIMRRSASSGFRALFMQMGAVGGAIAGVAIGVGAAAVIPSRLPMGWGAGVGVTDGAIAGLAVALVFNFAWMRLLEWGVLKGQAWVARRRRVGEG